MKKLLAVVYCLFMISGSSTVYGFDYGCRTFFSSFENRNIAFRSNIQVKNSEGERMYFYKNSTFKVIGPDGTFLKGTYTLEDESTNILLKFENEVQLYGRVYSYKGSITKIVFNGNVEYLPFR